MKETPISPEMLAIMQSLAERIEPARTNAEEAASRFGQAIEQLEAYIRQCAQLLGLPPNTHFDKPKAVFLLKDKE